jgi:hypothetical protein
MIMRTSTNSEKILGDDQAAAFFTRQQRAGFEIPQV